MTNAFPGGFLASTWCGEDSNRIAIALEGDRFESAEGDTEWSYELSIVGDDRGGIRVQEERFHLRRAGREYPLIRSTGGVREAVNCDGSPVLRGPEAARSFLGATVLVRLSAWLLLLQTKYSDAFARIQRVCRDVLPEVESLFSGPTEHGTVMVGSRERHLRRPVTMWEMSDGELVFVALLSLIYSPPDLGASLYLVEEPENYLHPRLIEVLIELLGQVQDELRPARPAQVVATTHSPFLIDKVSLDELIVFEKREGATVVTYPRDKVHLRDLLQRQELGLGDLYYSGALSR